MEENNTNSMDQAAPIEEQAQTPSFSFVSDEEVSQMSAPVQEVVNEPTQETLPPVEEQPTQEQESVPQQETVAAPTNIEYSDSDVESAVMGFLSEKLGRQISSIDDLSSAQQEETVALDERIASIAKFVEDTGRSPEDWFRYQSLNPESMDDMTAIRIELANSYPNLSFEELSLLSSSKYKVDPDLYTEDEVRLSQLQLKIDGQKARSEINSIRSNYAAPEVNEAPSEPQSIINDDWIASMSKEVDALTGLEFDLGEDKTFEFGLDQDYKSQLKNKHARLDSYFDEYINQDGRWDYDKLSSDRAVVDNIDKIVKSAYTKGLGDGQKNLLNTAANVSTDTPKQNSSNNQSSSLTEQLKQALGQNSSGFGFI